jgi:hypothetical protein
MPKAAALFLQAMVLLVGLAALVFLAWEPWGEGVNAQARGFADIYLDDPFLVFGYAASLPFFVGLAQLFRLLGLAGRAELLAPQSFRPLRILRRCALLLLAAVAAGELLLLLQPSDDRAGGVAMGVLISLGALGMAAAATLGEHLLARALAGAPR